MRPLRHGGRSRLVVLPPGGPGEYRRKAEGRRVLDAWKRPYALLAGRGAKAEGRPLPPSIRGDPLRVQGGALVPPKGQEAKPPDRPSG